MHIGKECGMTIMPADYRLLKRRRKSWELIDEGDKDFIYSLFLNIVSSNKKMDVKVSYRNIDILVCNALLFELSLYKSQRIEDDLCPGCMDVSGDSQVCTDGEWEEHDAGYEHVDDNEFFACDACHDFIADYWDELWAKS